MVMEKPLKAGEAGDDDIKELYADVATKLKKLEPL